MRIGAFVPPNFDIIYVCAYNLLAANATRPLAVRISEGRIMVSLTEGELEAMRSSLGEMIILQLPRYSS